MKSTGIVRKIDELGRVVIPKETRKVLCMDIGDPLEVFVENGAIVLKPYYAADEISDLVERIGERLGDISDPKINDAISRKLVEIKALAEESKP